MASGIVKDGKYQLVSELEYAIHERAKGNYPDLVPLEEKYPDDDVRIQKAIRMMFENGETDFSKVMWRMAAGSRSRAFDLGQGLVARYGYILDECAFDNACAEITGGCEVEWESE